MSFPEHIHFPQVCMVIPTVWLPDGTFAVYARCLWCGAPMPEVDARKQLDDFHEEECRLRASIDSLWISPMSAAAESSPFAKP